jgi:hypothetical protein
MSNSTVFPLIISHGFLDLGKEGKIADFIKKTLYTGQLAIEDYKSSTEL